MLVTFGSEGVLQYLRTLQCDSKQELEHVFVCRNATSCGGSDMGRKALPLPAFGFQALEAVRPAFGVSGINCSLHCSSCLGVTL